MKNSMISKPSKKAKLFALLIIATLILTTACNTAENGSGGSYTFTLEVTDASGNVTTKIIETSEQTVGAALLSVGIIEGIESDFGLMVEYVNGIRADFNEDNAWWAFYINGEMAMAGVDGTNIEEGATYAFIFTPA